jgi:hypothetical protein
MDDIIFQTHSEVQLREKHEADSRLAVSDISKEDSGRREMKKCL